jgi:hypothetical protein
MEEDEPMTTFADLIFKPHPIPSGVQAIINFSNGYAASVVRTQWSYGGSEGLYELAILKDDAICYDTPITNDVLGHLTEDGVTEALQQIEALA